jgi:hypothetical protein
LGGILSAGTEKQSTVELVATTPSKFNKMGFRNIFHRSRHSLGDISQPLARGQKVKPDEVRELADLIRKRYKLDVEIWDLRHVQPHNRPVVKDKMRQSDATLQKISATIAAWNSPDAFESPKDWAKMQEIKKRIKASGKRNWALNPPWDD